jgi:hypothetical protein
MTLRTHAAALLALAALGLAACSEDTPSPGTSGASEDEVRQARVKFAECMREQGVDMPDPSAAGELKLKVGGDSGTSLNEAEAASKACDKYRKNIRPQVSEEDQQEFKERALAHSRCMREHGIDFPDPTFDVEGARVQIRAGSGKMNPDDPKFKAAEEACGGLMGKGPSTTEGNP